MAMTPRVVFGRSRIKDSAVALPALMLEAGVQDARKTVNRTIDPMDVAFFIVRASLKCS
jgi:hypothetical protein